MGTSQSSKGSPSNVFMVPPWVPKLSPILPSSDLPTSSGEQDSSNDANTETGQEQNWNTPQMAPPRRFLGVNRCLRDYARNADRGAMLQGLSHYVKKGYGGRNIATQRMGNTVHTAQALFSALSGGVDNKYTQSGSPLDPLVLAGRSAKGIMDAIVDAVREVDGTQDAEANRASISDALTEVLARYPEADLINLDTEQRDFAIEQFVAIDVFRRIDLDVGHTVRDKASDMLTGLSRLKEIKNYVCETVFAAFRNLRIRGISFTSANIMDVTQRAIYDTFTVFEEYIK